MTKEDIRLLYEYDRWANSRAVQQAASLSPDHFTRDLGGSFPSVRDTLLHILGGEWIWLQYWKDPPENDAALTELRARRTAMFRPDSFPDAAALRPKWTEVEKDMSEFIEAQTAESLEQRLPVRGARLSLGHIMQHVANHSTYHRGQLALMTRQLHVEPLPADFHVFLIERSS